MAAIKTLCLTSLFLIVSRISALQTGSDSKTACESSDVTIGFNFTIGNDSFADRSWYKNSVIPANKIARVVGAAGSLTVESQYIGRIALSGSGGILLYNVTKTDSGSYLFIIVTGTYFEDGTATTTVNVYVNPNASCMPKIEKNSADKFNCTISDACPGKDSIQAIWDDRSVGVFTCPSTTKDTKYKCCAKGDPVTYCNSGGLCTDIECKGSATTTTVKETSTTTASTTGDITSTTTASTTEDIINTTTATPSMNSTSTTNGNGVNNHQLVIIISVSVSAAVLVIIIICCCLHHRRKRKKKQTKHKAHDAIARNGSKSTNERNKLHNVTNTSQVDSSLDVSTVPKTKSDKGNSNAQILSSTRI